MIPMRVCLGSRTVEGTSITTVIGENEDISSLLAELPITRKGSGTPSASNIRPFVLWDEVTIYDADDNVIYHGTFDAVPQGEAKTSINRVVSAYGYIASYDGEELLAEWYSDRDADGSASPTLGAEVVYALDGNISRNIEVSDPLPTYSEGDTFSAHGEADGSVSDEGYAEGSIATIPPAETVTEDGVTYTPASRSAKSVVIGIEPKQSGSGTPSPDNIRPISGWTGAEVQRTGKNLIDTSTIRQGNFASLTTPTNVCSDEYFPVKGGQTYVWNTEVPNMGGRYVVRYDSQKNQIGNDISLYGSGAKTFSTTDDTCYIRVYWYRSSGLVPQEVQTDQLELGSTATAYEPYHGTTYPISWQTEAGTVYGGRLDVVSGVLADSMRTADLGSLNWDYLPVSSTFPYGLFYTSLYWKTYGESNYLTECYGLSNNDFLVDKATIGNAGGNTIYIMDSSFNGDTTAFKSSLNGKRIVYERKDPQTYRLTPTDIALLQGQNNVWADTGDTEVTYDTLFYVDAVPNLEAEIGTFKEYEGTMCGKRHIPNFPTNPLVEPLLKAVVNGENALMTTDCVEVAPCGAVAVVCEATVCNTVVACDNE